MSRGENKAEISEGKVDKENNLSFVVVREFNGQQFKIKYQGKLEADTIKGNIIFNVQGEERKLDWTANRVKQ